MKALVCINTLNEEQSIGALVRGLRKAEMGVLVVDGGSRDRTVAFARQAGAFVMLSPVASIREQTLLAWFLVLRYLDFQHIVCADAGGSHNVPDIVRVASALKDGYHLVTGSRFMQGSMYQGRLWRAVASRLFSVACNLKTGRRITDWTSGLRGYHRTTISMLMKERYFASMHSWQIEVAALVGSLVHEVPIHYRAGRSSFSWAAAWEALGVWWRL